MSTAPTPRYDAVSQTLHWVTAIAVLAAFILGPGGFGRMLHNGIDPGTQSDVVWHESLGMLIFVVTLLRLLWTVVRPPPPRTILVGWMHVSSKFAHFALWAMLLALPITALLTLGSEGAPLTLLGGVRLDQLPLIAGSGIAEFADWGEVHSWMGDVIIWLAGLHAAAAIHHHVALKDGVLASMLPWLKSR
jgi:cytochrome b561